MARALEEQNRLAQEEQHLRAQEILTAEKLTEARIQESAATEERNRLAITESQERQALLESCKNLQSLVAELIKRLDKALGHSVVLDALGQVQADIRDLLGIMTTLTVAVVGIMNDDDPRAVRKELRGVQEKVLEILGRSVASDTNIVSMHSDRDGNVTVKGG